MNYHIALICPELSGHTNPMTTLGCELLQRGHRVTLFAKPDGRSAAIAAGLDFHPVGEAAFPVGSVAQFAAELGRLKGDAALRYTLQHLATSSDALLEEGLLALRDRGVDLLLVDQVSFPAGSVAELLGLPFISISNALIMNQEPGVPPPVLSWSYRDAWWARGRNRAGYMLLNLLARSVLNIVDAFRRRWKLPVYRSIDEHYSRLAQISQQPHGFEFPRRSLPACFHFAGPFHNVGNRQHVPFPYEKLTGQPLIYASMGTLQNRLAAVFPAIAAACAGLDAQLVIALGGAEPDELPHLPGSPIVVKFAPQLELLRRAALTITHAGLNTVLESLASGVPMVAIPITNDQPAVAARLEWSGAGEVVPLSRLSAPRLRKAIQRVLREETFRTQAARFQQEIAATGGVRYAADIVERVAQTGQPVDLQAMLSPHVTRAI